MIKSLPRSVLARTTGRHCATIGRAGPAEIRAAAALLVALATLPIAALPPAARASAEVAARHALMEEHRAIRDAEAEALEAVALGLDRDGRGDHAAEVRALIVPEPPADGPRRFDPLPEIVPARSADDPEGSDPPPEAVASAREEAARAFWDLTDRAFEAGGLALADSCLREILRRLPDDPEARRLLGYVPHDGGWATPHAVLRLKDGDVFHETYGWIPGDWEPQLDRGLLPAPSRPGRGATRWLPAAEADAFRQREIASGWQITTPHFKIQASVPLDEGIDFARRLEAFHDLFTSLLADVIGPERLPIAQRRRAPGSTAPPNAARQHRVSYFGTKRQYVDYLTPRLRDPKIKDTLGIYLDDQRVSFFFKDEGGELASEATLYHEVSHQLLFELSGPSGYRRNPGDFWVFEGLGTYFETVDARPDGSIRHGGKVGPRIAEARRRIVERDELIPIDRFVRLDRLAFGGNDGGDPHLHYAQAIALTVFLMDHDRASLREPFLDYADDAYRGRLRGGSSSPTLPSHLGMTYDELDRALRSFLADPADPEAIAER